MAPDDWRFVRLVELLREPIRNGYSPVCPKEPTGKWMLSLGAVTPSGFDPRALKPAPANDPRVESALLQPGDIVVSRSNTRERVGLAGLYGGHPARCGYPDLLMRVRVGATALPEFITFALLSSAGREYFKQTARGTSGSMLKIDRGILETFPLRLPPLGEQRKIAAILSSVDDAIEAAQAVIDQLQVVKTAMMAELLTRGLPGRHTKFKKTEIGEVPERWQVCRVRELAALSSGGTPSRDRAEFWNGGIPWVKTGEIDYGVIGSTEETISELGLKNSAAKLLPAGTLLMAMYGQGVTRGRVAVLGIEATVNQACLAIRPSERLSTRFLFHVFASKYEELRSLGHEGSQKNLNAQLVGDVSIPVPDADEQASIIAVLDAISERNERERGCVEALREVKQSLMTVLLTGEVRVAPEEVAA